MRSPTSHVSAAVILVTFLFLHAKCWSRLLSKNHMVQRYSTRVLFCVKKIKVLIGGRLHSCVKGATVLIKLEIHNVRRQNRKK